MLWRPFSPISTTLVWWSKWSLDVQPELFQHSKAKLFRHYVSSDTRSIVMCGTTAVLAQHCGDNVEQLSSRKSAANDVLFMFTLNCIYYCLPNMASHCLYFFHNLPLTPSAQRQKTDDLCLLSAFRYVWSGLIQNLPKDNITDRWRFQSAVSMFREYQHQVWVGTLLP